jgi:predicted DNA-binding protein
MPNPLVQVRVAPDVHAQLHALSEEHDRTIANVVRRAVRFYLANSSEAAPAERLREDAQDGARRARAA